MSNARGGFSLLEVLVACALMGVLGTLFMAAILPTVRITAQQPARAEIQQQAILALNAMASAVESTTAAGLSLSPASPVALAVVPLAEVDNQGRQLWTTNMSVFYWDVAQDRILERTWKANYTSPSLGLDPTRPYQASAAELGQVAASNLGTVRSLALGVNNFTVAGTGSGLGMPLNITLVLQRKIPQKEEMERFTASKVITARQSR